MFQRRRNNLEPLLKALEGYPTESNAVRVISMYAVIPATIAGLLAGALLVPVNAPTEHLLWATIGGSVGAAAFVLLGIQAVYVVFGFRPIRLVAYSFLGALMGLALGGFFSKLVGAPWPIALALVGAIGMPLLAGGNRPKRPEPNDENPFDQPPHS